MKNVKPLLYLIIFLALFNCVYIIVDCLFFNGKMYAFLITNIICIINTVINIININNINKINKINNGKKELEGKK